jgi:hypothetical protein
MHERNIAIFPSSPITGRTQVMQIPIPQAIASSTAHWWTTSVPAVSADIALNIPIGPQE